MKAILVFVVVCLSVVTCHGQIKTGLGSPPDEALEILNQSQLTMYGRLLYQINANSPEFCIAIDGNVDGIDSFNINVEYSCQRSFSSSFACLGSSLPIFMYAQGTRYQHMGMAEANKDTTESTPLEARQSWHTFPKSIINTATEQITNIRFLVTKNRPIKSVGEFNFLQLYFRFTKSHNLRNGDWITIYIKNINVYGKFQSPVRLPDFEVRFRLQDPSSLGSLDEEADDGSRSLQAEGWETIPIVTDLNGRQIPIPIMYYDRAGEGNTIDWSFLANGWYYISFVKNRERKIQKLIVFR